ncbi:helix-turn-helix transcriptional regulator [Actinomyces ruminis]|uniref:Transcriptional regulator n=1 Tax=Actinomyces ruminis TaxID=1937003 RepID=A0ABX4MEY5_9ACTO|nr:helix-turn-helix domain-containing protein [Actinomyces ruminis]PHP53733.1 transcriptional regulator [Actinomyces ruminis]
MSVPAVPLPRPAWTDLSARAELSQARRRVLEEVEHTPHPLTAAQVARTLNLHHNTVREHLDALAEAGLVTVSTSSTGRRGRPALRYAPAGPDPAQVVGSYLTLLDAIVEQLGDGEQARLRALAIGRRWAQLTPADPLDPPAQEILSAAQLTALLPHLSRMGFAPDFDGEQVILKACPLMTSSRPPHPLVCLMHEGFLNERYAGASPDVSTADGAAAVPVKSIQFSVAPLCADGCHVTAETATTRSAHDR